MKNREMRKALDKAIKQWQKADGALQIFGSYIRFDGFGEFEPKIAFVSENSIILSFDGDGELLELSAEEAIVLMETKGCITPEDFNLSA